MAYRTQIDIPNGQILILGPHGRLRGRVSRGRITPNALVGLMALQRPGYEQRLRGNWEISIDTKSRRQLMLSTTNYRVEFVFRARIPDGLEQAFRDVFCRHRSVGTTTKERVERMAYANLHSQEELDRIEREFGRPHPREATPAKMVAWYRKLRVEHPEAWERLKQGKPPFKGMKGKETQNGEG